MNAARGCLALCFLSLAALLTPASPAPSQTADPRLEKVFADWRKRQECAKTVFYRLSGEKTVAKVYVPDEHGLPVLKDLPKGRADSLFQRTFLADWVGGRYRLEIDEKEYDLNTDKLYPRVEVRLFDGVHLKGFRPRDRNTHPRTGLQPSQPEIGIGSGYLGGAAIEINHWPLFIGHGAVPTRATALKAGNLKVLPTMELMVVHGQTVHRGRTCLVLRTQTDRLYQSFDEFWVDPGWDSAIVRQLLYTRGQPELELDIGYQKTPAGWLPGQWTLVERDCQTGNVVKLERAEVKELAVDLLLGESDFDIEEKRGMKVQELFHEGPKKPGDPWPKPKTKLFLVDDTGLRREIAGGTASQESYRWWWLTLLIPALALAGWLAYRWKRARQHAHS